MHKIVFMGTPDFAVPSMQHLLDAGHDISLLICQPDRKKGRGQKYKFPPTKQFALENNIDVIQPEKLRNPDIKQTLLSLQPDFFVVIAYGRILPKELLEIPTKGCINVHASLLPKWRGAAPIQFSLLHGDLQTGVCTMLMDEGMDTGDILLTRITDIQVDERFNQLSNRLSILGAELIVETINSFDQIIPKQQDHNDATYTRLLQKEDRIIDWSKDAATIFNQFRAMSPDPGAVTQFRNKRLIIKDMLLTEYDEQVDQYGPGSIVSIDNEKVKIVCGNGFVSILSCQPESKKEMAARDFVNGYQVKTGEILGEIRLP